MLDTGGDSAVYSNQDVEEPGGNRQESRRPANLRLGGGQGHRGGEAGTFYAGAWPGLR